MKLLIEELAELVHDEWAHWTKYMLDNMTPENIARWRRQIETKYCDLSPEEMESDRIWARAFYEVFRINNLYKTDSCGMIICGFPGVGKTELAKNKPMVVDLESSVYPKGDDWARWYVQDAIVGVRAGRVVLVSSHAEVREELSRLNRFPVVMVYPYVNLKEEYRKRYIDRGSSEEFVERMMLDWDSFLKEMRSNLLFKHVVLSHGEYLSDACDRICQLMGVGEPAQVSCR